MEFSNKHFYGGKIIAAPSISERLPKVEHPMLFVNTNGREEREGEIVFGIVLFQFLYSLSNELTGIIA